MDQAETSVTQSTTRAAPVIIRPDGEKKKTEDEPDMTRIEGRDEMHTRLLEGTKPVSNTLMCSDSDGIPRKFEGMPPMTANEADRLVGEIAEIKSYLFCRLLLNNAVLLPAAIKADSLDEFFKDIEVKTQDLRDLCLRLEQPQLQEIRDACADFFRKDDEPSEQEEAASDDEDSEPENEPRTSFKVKEKRHKHHLPSVWRSKQEKALKAPEPEDGAGLRQMLDNLPDMNDSNGAAIDFGVIDDKGEFQKSKMRVRICGRYIYNYPRKGSMKRAGWLHFSIIARGCSLGKAAGLCKTWDEFHELNILTLYRYFPSPEWLIWNGGMMNQQFLQVVSSLSSSPIAESDKHIGVVGHS